MELMKRIAAALRKEDIEVYPSAQEKALHVVHNGEVYKILAVRDRSFLDKLRRREHIRRYDPAQYEVSKDKDPTAHLTHELIAAKHPELF